jgi:hypothetical protein
MCEESAQLKRALFSQSNGCMTSFISKHAVQDVVRALPCISAEMGDEKFLAAIMSPVLAGAAGSPISTDQIRNRNQRYLSAKLLFIR